MSTARVFGRLYRESMAKGVDEDLEHSCMD
jgi:hypothetical protein